MSLSQALATAMAGLRVTQTGLANVSSNVANSGTAGFVRKSIVQVTTPAGDTSVSVRVQAVNRELDLFGQRQLRVESAGGAYASTRAEFYQRLQGVYGEPGSNSAIETTYNKFTTALQTLATSPESAAARAGVLSTAQILTQHLNTMTADIQSLRSDAELALSDAVQTANSALVQIADINRRLAASSANDATAAALMDQRDNAIDQLAELMDVRVVPGDRNQVALFTGSGLQLVGDTAAQLSFDAHGALTAGDLWSADPSVRNVGTIALQSTSGTGKIDLIAEGSFRSGKIRALLEMRDHVLVEAQRQVDELAAGIARALSDRTEAGTPVTAGAQSGFDIDVGSLVAGNSVRLTYKDNVSGATRTVTIVRVDDLAALPLPNDATADASDRVIGLDFSGGAAAVAAKLNAALGATGLQFSNIGTVLRVLDDGATDKVDLNAVSSTRTITTLASGVPELPFFTDGAKPYTGAFTSAGSQAIGFAGRIAVNPALLLDPARLVAYATSPPTPAGDGTRPNFLYDQLVSSKVTVAPQSGIGTVVSPFTGTLPALLRQIISQQGEAASAADSLNQGQQIVVNTLRERVNKTSGVNVDEEMANLLALQNAYGANARVLTTVKEMFDLLMRI